MNRTPREDTASRPGRGHVDLLRHPAQGTRHSQCAGRTSVVLVTAQKPPRASRQGPAVPCGAGSSSSHARWPFCCDALSAPQSTHGIIRKSASLGGYQRPGGCPCVRQGAGPARTLLSALTQRHEGTSLALTGQVSSQVDGMMTLQGWAGPAARTRPRGCDRDSRGLGEGPAAGRPASALCLRSPQPGRHRGPSLDDKACPSKPRGFLMRHQPGRDPTSQLQEGLRAAMSPSLRRWLTSNPAAGTQSRDGLCPAARTAASVNCTSASAGTAATRPRGRRPPFPGRGEAGPAAWPRVSCACSGHLAAQGPPTQHSAPLSTWCQSPRRSVKEPNVGAHWSRVGCCPACVCKAHCWLSQLQAHHIPSLP